MSGILLIVDLEPGDECKHGRINDVVVPPYFTYQ